MVYFCSKALVHAWLHVRHMNNFMTVHHVAFDNQHEVQPKEYLRKNLGAKASSHGTNIGFTVVTIVYNTLLYGQRPGD